MEFRTGIVITWNIMMLQSVFKSSELFLYFRYINWTMNVVLKQLSKFISLSSFSVPSELFLYICYKNWAMNICLKQHSHLESVHYLWLGGGGVGKIDRQKKKCPSHPCECMGKKIPPPQWQCWKIFALPSPPQPCFKNMPLCCCCAPTTVIIHVMSLSRKKKDCKIMR